ncbi:MAG: hypothetical protein CM1200mP24_02000 [Gammaproteobacteria bacterium]|nr:MAG: hypothetical protein CM1200mP24_02000 [Gammaproteobacteria bacterium]
MLLNKFEWFFGQMGMRRWIRPKKVCFRLYAERAQLVNGQRVLDLGCGWGSFTLWAAEKFSQKCFYSSIELKDSEKVYKQQCDRRDLKKCTDLYQRHK